MVFPNIDAVAFVPASQENPSVKIEQPFSQQAIANNRSSSLMNQVWNWSTEQSAKNAQTLLSANKPDAGTPAFNTSKFFSSFVVGTGASFVSAIPNLVTGILNYKAQQRSNDINESLGNRALDLETKKFESDWSAAQKAGLLSPSQFGNLQTSSYFRNNGGSSLSNRKQYTSTPYSSM